MLQGECVCRHGLDEHRPLKVGVACRCCNCLRLHRADFPGGLGAVGRGCWCPVAANRHPAHTSTGEQVWYITEGCPVHDPDRRLWS